MCLILSSYMIYTYGIQIYNAHAISIKKACLQSCKWLCSQKM